MNRSVELELKTVSEANAREFWRVRAGRRSGQRDIVRAALNDTFGLPPLFSLVVGGWSQPNPIAITLTRMAPGQLDEGDNLPGSMKACRDEIAAWFGVDDRDRRITWSYAQERTAPGVYRIRIAIADKTPGEDRHVVRATTAEHDSGTLRRVRPHAKPQNRNPQQAPFVFVKSWALLPWEQPACSFCDGKSADPFSVLFNGCGLCNGTGRDPKRRRLAPLARYDGNDNPPSTITVKVPPEHRSRWPAGRVQLHRRRFASKATGDCWLYELQSPSQP